MRLAFGFQSRQRPSAAAPASPAYYSWTGPGWFDASEAASVAAFGTNKRVGGGNLTQGGTGANITVAAAAQNGLNAIRVVRDISSFTSAPRMVASALSTISTMFQGNDKPFTVILAFKPTDTNTGFIWTASDNVGNSVDSQIIGYARRSATAPGIRRQLLNSTANDVTWGSGQASGTARVVAFKHSGTAVTVWDNSATTKAVNGTAQNTDPFNTSLEFMLFASEFNNGEGNYYQVGCNMDFYEIVVEDTAKSDADIQQAITDMAAKWGITLS